MAGQLERLKGEGAPNLSKKEKARLFNQRFGGEGNHKKLGPRDGKKLKPGFKKANPS